MFMLAHACITPYNSVYHQWSKIHGDVVENRNWSTIESLRYMNYNEFLQLPCFSFAHE